MLAELPLKELGAGSIDGYFRWRHSVQMMERVKHRPTRAGSSSVRSSKSSRQATSAPWWFRLKAWVRTQPLLAVILVTGFVLRSASFFWGLPLSPHSGFFHPDEVKSWSSTINFPEDYFSSTNYLYGTAVQYAVAVLLLPLKWLLVNRLALFDEYVLVAVLVFRAINVVVGTAAILATWHLGRLAASERTGLIAAALLSVAFMPALNSPLTTLDVPMCLLTVLALLLMFRALGTMRPASFALLGLALGVLLATKITGGLILAVVIFWLVWRMLVFPPVEQRTVSLGKRLQFLALVMVIALVVFAITTPHVVLRLTEYVEFMRSQKTQWYDLAPWSPTAIARSWWQATSVCIGAPTSILAIAGIVFSGMISKEYRVPLLAAIAANYLFWLATLQARFVLPVAPLLCLFAAIACDRLLAARQTVFVQAGRALLAIALLWSLVATALGVVQKATDPRIRAGQFIAEHVPAGASIGIATDHQEQWQHHKWRYPIIDFRRYRDVYFLDEPDYIVVTALELAVMRRALASPHLLADDVWHPSFGTEWYLGQPPSPAIFTFYRDLLAGTRYNLRATFTSTFDLPLDGACPAVFLYERKK